ncbi:hypothetical protein BJV74DRAFT_264058 [Russula compacta]|nr:hypothetical protein BJV74DRAFT_264058 [Russula compacta]
MSWFRKRDRNSVSGGRRQGGGSSQPTLSAPGPLSTNLSSSSSSSHSTSTRVPAHSPASPPAGWSTSSGPTPGAYPLQGSLSQQGGSPHQDNFTRPENGAFPGGFIQQGNATSPNASAFTRSNSAFTRSNSAFTRSDSISRTGGFASQASQGPQVVPPDLEHDEAYNWFVAIDQDGNRELSPEELRSALLNDGGEHMFCSRNEGQAHPSPDQGMRFSTSTIKYLMGIFDLDGNGVIGFEEFKPLWNYMTQWRQMFDSFDADNDRTIDVNELGSALAYYNLEVGPSVLELLVKKYGITPLRNRYHHGYGHPPRPQLDLDHFVCACIVVQQMCGLYDRCCAGGQPEIGRDEFLLAVISLP